MSIPSSVRKTRESLRDKGQFWTPDWVAQAMTVYAVQGHKGVFDPGVGRGAFGEALEKWASLSGAPLSFSGSEIDAELLSALRLEQPDSAWLKGVTPEDFLLRQSLPENVGIVANPPYIRHHRLSADRKCYLQRLLAQDAPGLAIDGRAGLHVYFLLHALALASPGTRLAFIVPADIVEGVFANDLWHWIAQRFALEAVWTFTPQATPFQGVDTNPIVLCLRAGAPVQEYVLARVHEPNAEALLHWVKAGMPKMNTPSIRAERHGLEEALKRGVSRPPLSKEASSIRLGDLVRVVRGIATGDNDFFFLTDARRQELKLPASCFVRAVGRTRDAQDPVFSKQHLGLLEAKGRPTWLLSLAAEWGTGLSAAECKAVRAYLDLGQAKGLPERALISQRKPWYRMEKRLPPPWLFAYLGRRDARFIRNQAEVVPLTGFLCVYPHEHLEQKPGFRKALDHLLAHPDVLQFISQIGKTYGGGAVKAEPRALERLPLPQTVVKASGIEHWLS